MDLSIVIPVWNEAAKIATDIRNINNHFSQSTIDIEVIIVDDGSVDETILFAKKALNESSLDSNVIKYPDHKGKGYAVRQGILASQGAIVMFMDCGSNIPLSFIDDGMEFVKKKGAKIVLGTRYHRNSKIIKNMILSRRITSALFRYFTKFLLDLPAGISDSQCGFKIFDGNVAREIFNQIEIDGFLFDLEGILQAKKKNYKITELPIEWHCDRDSRLNVVQSFLPIIREFLYLRKI